MKTSINIPEDLFLNVYQLLVLYGLMHDIGDNESFNTKIKMLEELYKKQTGKDI